jgi:hypothetical protein
VITAAEVSRSIYGAWLLARFDGRGTGFFENTVEGFWRSFWAAGVALPAYGLLLIVRSTGATIGVSAPTALLIHSIAYVMGWIAFPFLMYYVARLFDREQWYLRYIAAYNWAVVLQLVLMLLVSAISASGILPQAAGTALTVITVLAILIYQGFIAHVALQTTLPGAVGIVFMDLVLSMLLDSWSSKLLQLQRVVS